MNSTSSFILASLVILGLITSPSLSNINADNHEIMSPKKQMASGIAAKDVMCKSEFVLMIRSTSGTAACVKSTTSLKLSEAGWGDVIETAMDEVMDEEGNDKEIILEEEFSMGEQDQMDENANQTIIELEEGISAGEEGLPDEESPEDVFSIGGIDLSMASPVEGNVDAPLTIIEFGDYQCPKCKGWFQDQKSTITNDYISTGIAKFYFVDFAWLGDDSVSAAQASHCADDQGKFSEYHSTLYTNQADIESGWASPAALKQFAMDLELDSELFDECLDTGVYADRVSYNTDAGLSAGITTGTPHFFIVAPDGETKEIAGPQPAMIFDFAVTSLGYGP